MIDDGNVQEEIARLRARVEELEGERRTSRRRVLGLAGAAVAGGAAALLPSSPVAATTGTMQFGAVNNAGGTETTLNSSATSALAVNNTGSTTAVLGHSTAGGTGVLGQIESPNSSSYGVWGLVSGNTGYAVVAEGGQSQLFFSGTAGPTVAGSHSAGEFAYDGNNGVFWICVAGGSPGTWRKLGSSTTAGSFHAITPARVYDSRSAGAMSSPLPLSTGQSRTVSVANSLSPVSTVVPTGATAITFTITVVNTVGTNGYLAVNPGGVSAVSASTINWPTAGTVLANSSVVKLDASRQIQVICGGTSTSTNFIVDVLGYYL